MRLRNYLGGTEGETHNVAGRELYYLREREVSFHGVKKRRGSRTLNNQRIEARERKNSKSWKEKEEKTEWLVFTKKAKKL